MSPLVSALRPRERSHRPGIGVLGGASQAGDPERPYDRADRPDRSAVLGDRRQAASVDAAARGRIYPDSKAQGSSPAPPARTRADERWNGAAGGAPPAGAAAVLLAGADPRRRASLRVELSAKLGARTRFCEAVEVSEVLERAPRSSMVILTGDLDDADGESLVRLLGRRHPRLPVVMVREPSAANAGGRG